MPENSGDNLRRSKERFDEETSTKGERDYFRLYISANLGIIARNLGYSPTNFFFIFLITYYYRFCMIYARRRSKRSIDVSPRIIPNPLIGVGCAGVLPAAPADKAGDTGPLYESSVIRGSILSYSVRV